jgi:hypothetical protein
MLIHLAGWSSGVFHSESGGFGLDDGCDSALHGAVKRSCSGMRAAGS